MSGEPVTLVVGDIHGCYEELIALVELANLGEHGTIVGVGDLIDRGPMSREVVDFFAADPARRRCVRGNHEQKHLTSRGKNIQSRAGRILRKQVTESHYAAMLDYFETMPYWIDLPDALVVHAGLTPGQALEKQPFKVLMGIGSIGRVGFDGKSPWWYDQPDLPTAKPIVFGHEKHPEGIVRGARSNVYGIDTGAAFGGPLTGLLLPEFRLISVPVPNYWEAQLQEWLPILLADDVFTMSWEELSTIDPCSPSWPEVAREELASARHAFDWVVSVIEQRREDLLTNSRYLDADGARRGELNRQWRSMVTTDLDRLVIESIPSRDAASLVRKKYPVWSRMEESLSELQRAANFPFPSCR